MFDIKKTIKKAIEEGSVVAGLGVIALTIGGWVALKAEGIGVELEPEWFATGIIAVGAAIYTGIKNWIKNRNK